MVCPVVAFPSVSYLLAQNRHRQFMFGTTSNIQFPNFGSTHQATKSIEDEKLSHPITRTFLLPIIAFLMRNQTHKLVKASMNGQYNTVLIEPLARLQAQPLAWCLVGRSAPVKL